MANRRTARRTAHRATGAASDLDRAVKELLRALPFGHLDQRLNSFQRWLVPVEKELRHSGRRVGRAAAETAHIAFMGPGAAAAPRNAHRRAGRRART